MSGFKRQVSGAPDVPKVPNGQRLVEVMIGGVLLGVAVVIIGGFVYFAIMSGMSGV